jgi:hypothetical protein
MSDTPETDERAVPHIGFYSCATVPAEFARQLERERDEAREKYATEATEHMLAVNKLCKERDEAREELHDIRLNLGEDAEGYTLTHAVCVLQQERDEAREEAHRFRSLHYSHLGINGSASAFPWEGK